MPELNLHVGLHKTATTSLQQFLLQNRKALNRNGLDYPEICTSEQGAHHPVAVSVSGRFPQATCEPRFRKMLEQVCAARENFATILSSEMFSEHIHMGLMALALDYFERVRVIVYLKRQDILRESIYNQIVKDGHECNEFTASTTYNYDFEKFCDRWADVFGEENIVVRPFEKGQLHKDDVLHDFLKVIGIEKSEGFSFPKQRENKSLPSAVIEFVRASNEFDKIDQAEFVALCSSFFDLKSGNGVGRMYQSPHARSDFVKQFAASNERVARRFLKRDDGVLFYEPMPDLNAEWVGPDHLSTRTAVRVAVEIWNHYKRKNS